MTLMRWIWLKIPIIGLRKVKIYRRIRHINSCDDYHERKAWGVYKYQTGYFGGRLTYIGGKRGWVPDGRLTERKRCGRHTKKYKDALLICRLLSDGVISGKREG